MFRLAWSGGCGRSTVVGMSGCSARIARTRASSLMHQIGASPTAAELDLPDAVYVQLNGFVAAA